MASIVTPEQNSPSLASTFDALSRAEGSASHGYVSGDDSFRGRHAARDLADSVHHLCLLHGRHPGVVDHAGTRTVEAGARDWLVQSIEGFAIERSFLTRVVVAAGPLPSTPGQSETESAVLAQHHALDMLAQSDRRGCALGAAAALVVDWHALRPVIEQAANRFSVETPAMKLPGIAATIELIATVTDSPAMERAVTFGAQQLLGQHRGLWDLLEARCVARGEW